MRKAWIGEKGVKDILKWGRVLSQSRRSGQGSGPGRASRRHDAAGQAGGRDAGRPEHRATTPDPFSPFPRVGLGHNCSPDTHALSTSSRTFHMFNIVSRAGRAAASLSCSPGNPERFRAGADPGWVSAAARRLELPKSAPSLATAAAPPVTRRDAGAEALRGAEVADFPPAEREAFRDS